MATYVFSDVHGHCAALERALDRVSPSKDDRFFCLGDMIDRGPDPVGVLRVVRGLPNVTVLMGNHEDLMIDCVNNPGDGLAAMNWGLNGGAMTSAGLSEIEDDEASELLGWVAGLPRWSSARVAGRLFLFVHAGVRLGHVTPEAWGDAAVETFFSSQDPEDLTWIREDFWGAAEGLSGGDARGPVIVAGHTPTPYLERMAHEVDRPAVGADGLARMVRVGADRWDVDSAAAAGAGLGQVLVLRLEDEEELYEPVLEGE